jgi:dTDP-4-amino-4,6-dideoxygalactose transaminase
MRSVSDGVATRSGVPFLDLGRSHAPIVEPVVEDIREIVESSRFVGGSRVEAFEEAFAGFCGSAHCVGVASGLDAIRLALQSLGIGRGTEVIVPAMTFVATFEAVSQVGGTPVPVDVSDSDYCLDAAATASVVGQRTGAILPVHLYGQMADMRALGQVAESHGLVIVEDACQAHGATRDGVRPGGLSAAAAFSFYPGKNLGAMGDAGALITDDEEFAASVRSLREHGQARKYEHDAIGWTSRLDVIQAAVLSRKLPYLDRWNEERAVCASAYTAGLTGVGDLQLPPVPEGSSHVWHLYVVRTSDPAGLQAFLEERGIASGRHYPEAPHRSKAYAHLGLGQGAFPVAEAIALECLSLPIFPGITEEEQARVVEAVRAWFAGG